RRPADEQVVDVAGLVRRQVDELAEPELGIPRGGLAPATVPPVEMREEDAQHRRLHLVEARVVADEVEIGLVSRAVEGEHPHALVREVTFAATSSGSTLSVTGSTSAKTGVAPRRAIDSAVA